MATSVDVESLSGVIDVESLSLNSFLYFLDYERIFYMNKE